VGAEHPIEVCGQPTPRQHLELIAHCCRSLLSVIDKIRLQTLLVVYFASRGQAKTLCSRYLKSIGNECGYFLIGFPIPGNKFGSDHLCSGHYVLENIAIYPLFNVFLNLCKKFNLENTSIVILSFVYF
jgi:hypothetical protein